MGKKKRRRKRIEFWSGVFQQVTAALITGGVIFIIGRWVGLIKEPDTRWNAILLPIAAAYLILFINLFVYAYRQPLKANETRRSKIATLFFDILLVASFLGIIAQFRFGYELI
jgi:hypothetical protein